MAFPPVLIPILKELGIALGVSIATEKIFNSFEDSSEAITAMLGEINQTLVDGFAGRDVDLESYTRQLVRV